jgi:hypothetical protein
MPQKTCGGIRSLSLTNVELSKPNPDWIPRVVVEANWHADFRACVDERRYSGHHNISKSYRYWPMSYQQSFGVWTKGLTLQHHEHLLTVLRSFRTLLVHLHENLRAISFQPLPNNACFGNSLLSSMAKRFPISRFHRLSGEPIRHSLPLVLLPWPYSSGSATIPEASILNRFWVVLVRIVGIDFKREVAKYFT